MSFPTIIQFHGMEASDALRTKIEEHAHRLDTFANDIHSCRVVISADRRSHRAGDRYRINVHLTIDRHEIHVGDSHAQDPRHADPYVATADAFDDARRCMEDFIQRRRDAARARRNAVKSA